MVVDSLRAFPPAVHLADLVDGVEDTLLDVDARIRALTEREGAVMGSTVAALVAHGDWGVCLWAGDSRIYRLRDAELTQITQDHAYVQDLVRAGLVSEAEAAHHPQANIVTRAVGAGPRLQLDAEVVELRPGDRFLLCSDGLVRDIDPEELIPALGGSLEGAAGALVRQALDVGAQDNVTALVVALEDGAAA
jgi:serine/threonine-protein phosphatase Stp1